jgi:hypothetical protein
MLSLFPGENIFVLALPLCQRMGAVNYRCIDKPFFPRKSVAFSLFLSHFFNILELLCTASLCHYAKRHYAKRHYAKRHYAKRHYPKRHYAKHHYAKRHYAECCVA